MIPWEELLISLIALAGLCFLAGVDSAMDKHRHVQHVYFYNAEE